MKRFLIIALSFLICAAAFSGCSHGGNDKPETTPIPQPTEQVTNEPSQQPTQAPAEGTLIINGYTVNDRLFDEKFIRTIKNEQYIKKDAESEGAIYLDILGMGFKIGENMQANYLEGSEKISAVIYDEGILILYTTDKAISFIPETEEEMDNLTEEEMEEINEKIEENTIPLCAVLRRPTDGSDQMGFEELKGKFRNLEELFEFDGFEYCFADNDVFDDFKLTKSEKKLLPALVEEFPFVRDHICVFRPEPVEPDEEPREFEGCLNDFQTKTMSGNDIDQSIFEKYDVTLVNVWATWCGYCVMELPGLQKLYEQLPDNVNIISVCTDASSEHELAQSQLEEAGVKFDTLIANGKLNEVFCNYVDSYPTTVFIDKDGNVIGDIHIGVPTDPRDIDALTAAYLDMIEQALKAIGK